MFKTLYYIHSGCLKKDVIHFCKKYRHTCFTYLSCWLYDHMFLFSTIGSFYCLRLPNIFILFENTGCFRKMMQNIVKCYIQQQYIYQSKRFSWTHCIFTLTIHLCWVVYTGKLCFIIKFIVFYGTVEIYLGLKLIKENQFMSLFPFLWIYTYRFVNSVVTVIPLIPYYYQLYKIPNKKQTDYQSSSHQKFTLYIYEKVFTCKNFICRKTPSLLCVIKNPAT